MYWNLFKGWLFRLWDGLFPRGFRRSSALPVLVMIALIGLPGLGYYVHRRGQISKLRREMQGEVQLPAVQVPQPGGVEPIMLRRAQTPGTNGPEFRSATLLPGLGMSLLQISAYVPGRGEVTLLAAPSLEEMADGTSSPKVGQNDTRGAFEVPWGGMLGGLLSPVGTLRTAWRGHQLDAPAEVLAHGVAVGGLLGLLSADSAKQSVQGGNPQASASYANLDFDGHWISRTDVNVGVSLEANAIVMTVTAKNVGDQPEPMGIGWHPRFKLLSGRREDAEVRLPNGQQLEVADTVKGLPSGKLVAPTARLARFQGHAAALGMEGIDESVVGFKEGSPGAGAVAELHDPGTDLGIRLTALSDSVREIRVSSPSGSSYISMGAQTNYDDPLGREWGEGDTPAITILQPGQTIEWKVRLEIFSLANRAAAKER